MDDIDRAAEREEIARENALRNYKKPEGPKPTGFCLYCGHAVEAPRRWCDAECRGEWSSLNE